MKARPLQDVRNNHREETKKERSGRFLTRSAPTGQHVKMFKWVQALPTHVKERAYPKQVMQEDDAE